MTQGQTIGAVVLCAIALWIAVRDWRKWRASKGLDRRHRLMHAVVSTFAFIIVVVYFLDAAEAFD